MSERSFLYKNKKEEMEYNVAKRRAQPISKQSTVCSSCEQTTKRNKELSNGNLMIR